MTDPEKYTLAAIRDRPGAKLMPQFERVARRLAQAGHVVAFLEGFRDANACDRCGDLHCVAPHRCAGSEPT